MADFSFTDLSNLINVISRTGGNTSERQSIQGDVFDDFTTKINSTFDNDLIRREVGRMESYVSANKEDMSDAMWDKYNYIKDRAFYNMEDNDYFNVYSAKIDSDAQEFNELMNSYNESEQEQKDAIIGELQTRVLDFVNNKNIMKRKFGTRLSKPEFHTEALKIAQYDELFQFGVASLTDDNYLSLDEQEAFFNSITQGDATPMQTYMTKEANHRSNMASINYQSGIQMVDSINYWGDLLDKHDDIVNYKTRIDDMLDGSEEKEEENTKFMNLLGQTAWVDMSDEDQPIPFTYEQLLLGDANTLLDKAQSEVVNLTRKFKNADKGYSALTGQFISDGYPITYSKYNPTPIPNSNIETEIDRDVNNNANNKNEILSKEEKDLIDEYISEKTEYDEAIAWLEANPEEAFEQGELYNLRNKYHTIKREFKKKWLKKKGGGVIKDVEGNITSDYRKDTLQKQAEDLIKKHTK